jgi:hypothetical protein
MIGHQTVGVYRAFELRGELGEVSEVGAVIAVLKKTWLPIVPALDDVDSEVRNYHASGSRHKPETRRRRHRLTAK